MPKSLYMLKTNKCYMPKDIYEKFVKRTKIDIPTDLRTSKNLNYILSKEQELKNHSKNIGEECVIGIWGYPRPCGRIEGYGIHTKTEAETILSEQKKKKDNRIVFGDLYYSLSWFKRKKERLKKNEVSLSLC